MMCEICDQLKRQYGMAVSELHMANEHLRRSKAGSLDAALSRREVHQSLAGLIAAEAEMKSHRGWHMTVPMISAPQAAVSL